MTSTDKEARLAAALRENLRKRKAASAPANLPSKPAETDKAN